MRAHPPSAALADAGRRPRDVRLDLFRGLAMLIIVVAHIPDNPWNGWIPARFGFSSAAEMFVFGSGLASALAFGRIFVTRGWSMGAARVAFRIWQLYWAQIAPFLVIVAISAFATTRLAGATGGIDYLKRLELDWFLAHPGEAIAALMTLRYIPQFFDMLPMYMVVLAGLPLAVALARINPLAPLALSVSLWLLVQFTGANLSARPDAGWVWFFNPFAWQLLFIAGFSFGMGWLPVPPLRDRLLVSAALTIVIGFVPISFWGVTNHVEALAAVAPGLGYDGTPTSLHPLRLIHFAALAYLALSAIEPWRQRLPSVAWLRPIEKVGQQTLAVFLSSLPAAWSLGIALDIAGRSALAVTLVNLAGLLAMVAVAYVVGWFKSQPWRKERAPHPARQEPARALLQPAE